MHARFRLLLIVLALIAAPLPSHALGPVDAEAGLLLWLPDIEATDTLNSDADANGVYAEMWLANRWGLAGQHFNTDPDAGGLPDTTSVSIDVKRRFLSATENNFIALGVGWQDSEMISGSSANGVRFLAEGRIGLGLLFVYGEAAYMPELGDAGLRRDLDATEIEFGVSFTPFPFLNLRAGYREVDTNFRGGSEKADGYYLGGAVHF